MRLPKIENAGVYTMAQKSSQIFQKPWISFYVKGAVKLESYYPDGSLRISGDRITLKPNLSIGYPGFKSVFEYGPDRENWVIMLIFEDLIFRTESHQFYLNYEGELLPVPSQIPVPSSEIDSMRETFAQISSCCYSQIPSNKLTAEILTMSLLLRFLEAHSPADDIVEHFRKLIDQDIHWDYSLEEISSQLKTGRDLIRKKFYERYKISPGEYRIRKRLQRIQYLLSYTTMNLQEISFEIGMKNQSHLSSFIRTHFRMTPSQLCRQHRGGNPEKTF